MRFQLTIDWVGEFVHTKGDDAQDNLLLSLATMLSAIASQVRLKATHLNMGDHRKLSTANPSFSNRNVLPISEGNFLSNTGQQHCPAI